MRQVRRRRPTAAASLRLPARDEPAGHAASDISPDDVATLVDAERVGDCRASHINSLELAFPQKKAMGHAGGRVLADDVALCVDAAPAGGAGAGKVDAGELATTQKEPVQDARSRIRAYDVGKGLHPERLRS